MSPCSLQVTCLCFHYICFHFMRVLSGAPCLFKQAPCCLCAIPCSSGCATQELKRATLVEKTINQFFWTSLFSRTISQMILPRRSLNRPKSSLLKIMVVILLYFVPSSSDPEVFHLTVSAAKTTPNLYMLSLSFLVHKEQVHQVHLSIFLCPQPLVLISDHQCTPEAS